MRERMGIQQFWLRHPLFWIGLHIFLGTGVAAGHTWLFLPLAAVLWLPLFRNWQRLLSAALLVSCSWYGASTHFINAPLPEKGLEGILYLSISQVKSSQTPFGPVLCYQGKGCHFLSLDQQRIKNLHCQILMKDSSKRSPANSDYLIHGRLLKSRKGTYIFKPDRKISWQSITNTHSFAETRLQFKRKVAGYIKNQFGKTPCSVLFASLATGDIDERTLSIEFSKLGLSHILAISGFHFALFAAFVVFFFSLFLSFRATRIVSLALVGAYLFFLGPCPSAMRACCAISLALSGKIFSLRASGINALGAGLALLLLIDPSMCLNLGFQLSFLCTAALLLLFAPCEQLLTTIFPSRTLAAIKAIPLLDQHGALLASLLRKSLALTLAVHIVTLPVCLFYFSSFPLLGSLIYNLFFPFLLTISLFLLLLSLVLFPLAPLINTLNLHYTNFLLGSVAHAPPALKAPLSLGSINPLLISIYLSSLLLFSLIWHSGPHPTIKLFFLNLRARHGQYKPNTSSSG